MVACECRQLFRGEHLDLALVSAYFNQNPLKFFSCLQHSQLYRLLEGKHILSPELGQVREGEDLYSH